MLMSNYLSQWLQTVSVMAVSQSSFGIRHPTVVPTNVESTEDDESAEAVDAAEIAVDAVDAATDSVDSE